MSRRLMRPAIYLSAGALSCHSTKTALADRCTPEWGYVTDVEGDALFWKNYVDLSRVVHRDSAGVLHLKDGAHFVFGGDTVDQGVNDVGFVDDLVSLYKRHPGRVHFILGNRDINKMRYLPELSKTHMEQYPLHGPDCHPGVWWLSGKAGETPAKELSGMMRCSEVDPSLDTRANRLKWMLMKNMGSPFAFEVCFTVTVPSGGAHSTQLTGYYCAHRLRGLGHRATETGLEWFHSAPKGSLTAYRTRYQRPHSFDTLPKDAVVPPSAQL